MTQPTPKRRFPSLLNFASAALMLSAASLTFAGCTKPAPPQNPKVLPRVENPAMAIAIGAVPPAFKVVSNEGAEIQLAPKEGEGEITIILERPELGGVNLPQMVKDWKDAYEAMEQGKYMGQVELTTQFGAAYTVRGTYLKDGAATEERRIFALHPTGDQVITLIYTYPEGNNSRKRTEDLFEIVSELESLDALPVATEGGEEALTETSP